MSGFIGTTAEHTLSTLPNPLQEAYFASQEEKGQQVLGALLTVSAISEATADPDLRHRNRETEGGQNA